MALLIGWTDPLGQGFGKEGSTCARRDWGEEADSTDSSASASENTQPAGSLTGHRRFPRPNQHIHIDSTWSGVHLSHALLMVRWIEPAGLVGVRQLIDPHLTCTCAGLPLAASNDDDEQVSNSFKLRPQSRTINGLDEMAPARRVGGLVADLLTFLRAGPDEVARLQTTG